MPSVIQAGTASNTALTLTSDTSGELQLKTNNGSTTAMTLTTGGNVGVGTTIPGGRLEVSLNTTTGAGASATGTIANFTGVDGTGASIYINGYGANAGAQLISRVAQGTAASPTAVNSSTSLLRLLGLGYNGSAFTSSRAEISFGVSETWTTTANGTLMTFRTTQNGTTSSSERMRIDDAGNVGIATSSPSSFGKFAVQGASTNRVFYADSLAQPVARYDDNSFIINGLTIRNSGVTGSNQGIGLLFQLGTSGTPVTAGVIQMRSEGDFSSAATQDAAMTFGTVLDGTTTERMRITSSGFVGIGTSSPSYPLDVQGSSGDVRVRSKSTGGGGGGIFVADGDGAGSFPGIQFAQSGTNYWTIGQRADTNLYLNREAGSGNVYFTGSNIFAPFNSQSTSLVVGGNGSTSNLGARVCIRSAIAAGASLNYAININDSNTNTAGGQNLIAWSHNSEDYSAGNVRAAIGATIDGGGAGTLVFRTGGFGSQAERMRIDGSGKLYLATTTDYGANINTVILSASGIGMTMQANTNGNWGHEFRNASGTNVGTIVINAGGTAYNTTSDYRLKENIAPMIGALDTVAQLKPVTYNWKADGSSGQGFIAHELQAVVPDCVTGEKDAVDADGKPVYQGIDTSYLVATLTAAIQELKAELDEAKAEIQALKGAR